MNMEETWYAIEESAIALAIGATAWFPALESIHVLAAVMVLGSILTVDLKLLGIGAKHYALHTLLKELTPWSWAAFVVAIITGLGLFITRAGGYADNKAFLIKMFLLVLAGVNMLWFHFFIGRRNGQSILKGEELITPLPYTAKISGVFSLVIWCGVMLSGRWIGHLI